MEIAKIGQEKGHQKEIRKISDSMKFAHLYANLLSKGLAGEDSAAATGVNIALMSQYVTMKHLQTRCATVLQNPSTQSQVNGLDTEIDFGFYQVHRSV